LVGAIDSTGRALHVPFDVHPGLLLIRLSSATQPISRCLDEMRAPLERG